MQINPRMLAGLVIGALAITACGCGKAATSGVVTGSVTTEGKPVTGGSIRFIAADGRGAGGQIDARGRYLVADAPLGSTKVTISNSHLKPKGGAAGPWSKMGSAPDNALPDPAGQLEYVKIDPAYESAETTTLTATVRAGKNSVDFDLR